MNSMCRKSKPDELMFWREYENYQDDTDDTLTSKEYIRRCSLNNIQFEISSYVPSVKIENWEDLRCLLYSEHFDGIGSDWIFRGQRNHNWFLESTLDRIDSKSIYLRSFQLNNFKKECRRIPDFDSYLSNISNNDNISLAEQENELWAVGQHYGLDTPLLDWTKSPYVALFFAFEEQENTGSDNYRVIYAINKEKLESIDVPGVTEGLFFEPKTDKFGRLVSQSGLFTVTPNCGTLEDTIIDGLREYGITKPNDIAEYICKIYIQCNNKDRTECLEHLQQMNIHYGTLFPDLIGATKYCNQLTKQRYGVSC